MPSEDEKNPYQERLDRIGEIFAGIVGHAEEVSLLRCPYRDREDRCTALFRCRNQLPVAADPESLLCGHDGRFDYRTAWETHPRARGRVKAKIDEIKRQAAADRGDAVEEDPDP